MATYVMLTSVDKEAIRDLQSFEDLAEEVIARLKEECPEVRWISSYSVLGPYDYLDVFDAPDNDSATKVAMIVRSFGHAATETWPATSWDRFKELVKRAA